MFAGGFDPIGFDSISSVKILTNRRKKSDLKRIPFELRNANNISIRPGIKPGTNNYVIQCFNRS